MTKLIFVEFWAVNLLVLFLLAWFGNQKLSSPDTLLCQHQMKLLQQAVNQYNRENPTNQKLSMEFGFPGFVEQILIPKNFMKEKITDLREKHSYYLQRNGFVNCREHPRNPYSLYLLGLVILTSLATLLELGFLGYQLNKRIS